MANTYKSGSHSRYLLQYHLIFVCKYRRKLLVYPSVIADIKSLSREICSRHNGKQNFCKEELSSGLLESPVRIAIQ
jgi:REP element-mobilizing transposase RayT